ncbi:hypothetical protein C7377_0986 [Balneicella halophila]|uniref:Uncharacterized protein n=1 Tax=Balneicella halophila TaxID=1537566 RepID=A0A7L4UNK5_BALHA|nr:hypothetical protein [Balneicella halophila]PVX50678.1 hypothetical protein C7377_0986 [Balneicella halophila]
MKKEKNTNHEADNQSNSSQLPEKSKVDILIERLEKESIKYRKKMVRDKTPVSIVYFPKPSSPLKKPLLQDNKK